MILPSVLEYDSVNLNRKTDFLIANKFNPDFKSEIIVTAADQKEIEKKLSLHLDFVLPQFAKDRGGILTSSGLESVFKVVENKFLGQKLDLTVHLMGELEDLVKAWNFFEEFKPDKAWKIKLLLPFNQYLAWKKHFKSFRIGVWLDLNDWFTISPEEVLEKLPLQTRDLLVMTVVAGKSGQKLLPEVNDKLIQLLNVCSKRVKFFLLDGGWSLEKAQNLLAHKNLKLEKGCIVDFVSYGSFWSKFNIE